MARLRRNAISRLRLAALARRCAPRGDIWANVKGSEQGDFGRTRRHFADDRGRLAQKRQQ